ncbi:Similar to Rnasel: 2-5A-dependent ribonuclease (Mus musculus) [Cotesia congregata]|uniref:Similar to Rnasel: 2-5A-dependent ribonuclease (Mus musculus) n=1 Tax=Cotesia congregata TaxID=51543 RepID=A0A8J2H987_COTCN|nr:Similar to Rnasel: 2-5A-dependent ribonuclease (Mus musculus) [Cotesia congregata]
MNNTREEIKDFKIFRELNYKEVRNLIMSKKLYVNTVVKIYNRDRIKIPSSEFLPLNDRKEYFFEYTILHLALYVDDDEFVDFLLENNADTKLMETEHLAPVILSAISLNSLKYVKKLVKAGADVNQIICVLDTYERKRDRLNNEGNPQIYYNYYTPLEFAVQLDTYKIAEFLISQGANVHGRIGNDGDDTDSPMGIAAFSDNVKMLKLLIKHGADINAGDDNGLTPLMKAAAEDDNSESRSQPLIEINSLNNDKKSCLHFPGVLRMGDEIEPESSLQDLLNAGCDNVNIVTNYQLIPMETKKCALRL